MLIYVYMCVCLLGEYLNAHANFETFGVAMLTGPDNP